MELQKRSKETLATSRISLKDSVSIRMLTLAAENSKTTVTAPMAELWKEILSPFDVKHIEHVFKNHIANSTFMPTVYDIRTALIALRDSRGGSCLTKEQENCGACGGSGWKEVTKPVDKNRSVVRCECRRQAAEKQGK